MEAGELDAYIDAAQALTRQRNADAERDFGLGGHARYDLDLDAGRMTFFDSLGGRVAGARVVPVGSWAQDAGSWLWAWENESIPSDISKDMRTVQNFGQTHDIGALQQTFAPCDEPLAWALASISLSLLDAQCVYRVEQSKSLLFLLLFGLTRE